MHGFIHCLNELHEQHNARGNLTSDLDHWRRLTNAAGVEETYVNSEELRGAFDFGSSGDEQAHLVREGEREKERERERKRERQMPIEKYCHSVRCLPSVTLYLSLGLAPQWQWLATFLHSALREHAKTTRKLLSENFFRH